MVVVVVAVVVVPAGGWAVVGASVDVCVVVVGTCVVVG